MENNNDKSIFDDFSVNEETKTHLADIARWTNINAIVGFAALAITLIAAFVAIGTYGGGGNLFGALITAGISLLLNITLLQAATNIKKGVAMPDQGFFGQGINKLSAYFKITGIITIIALVIMVLAVLVVLVAGAGRAF